MLGSYVSAAYASKPSETARRFFSGLLHWAGVQPTVEVSGGEVEVQVMETGKGKLLFAFNHGRETVTLQIKLDAGSTKARDLVIDRPVAVRTEAAGPMASSSILPGQVWVLHVE